MWLLKDSQLVFEAEPERINYAILSHTWESGEVLYGDLENGTAFGPQARSKAGMSKISNFCDTAQRKDLEFGWVDTCCIDKSSSAELTESINSMFKWYKSAAVCIVYLHDLAPATGRATSVVVSDLRRCKWFTRGWTLQELIAPSNVEFYDAEWNFRGTKDDLAPQLSQITRIDVEVLRNSDLMYNVPVARRMSWAADRVTTRLEDRAYSMLGIFDVNLSMIYGEGDKAFMRLQEAIAKENNDLSLFAWTLEPYGDSPEFRGIFAQDPSEFRRCDKLIVQEDPVIPKSPFSITNLGLEITACLASSKEHEDYLLNLHCSYGVVTIENQQNGVAAIRLVKTTKGYVRHSMNQPLMIDQALLSFRDPVSVYIPKALTLAECTAARLRLTNAMYVSIGGQAGHRAKITAWSPEHLWDSSAGLFLTGSHPHFTAVLELDFNTRADDPGNLPKVAVVIGLRHNPKLIPYNSGKMSTVQKENIERYGVSPWVELLNYSGKFGMLAHAAFKDPYALSTLGHRLRSDNRFGTRVGLQDPPSLGNQTIRVEVANCHLSFIGNDKLPYHEVKLDVSVG